MKAKEEEDRETKHLKPLLEYRAFRILHMCKIILMSLLMCAGRIDVFQIQHCCRDDVIIDVRREDKCVSNTILL